MDTTQIMDTIQHRSWLQLLVDLMQRVYQRLHALDRADYAADFAPYLDQSFMPHLYQVENGELVDHLQDIGQLMSRLVNDLAERYADEPMYRVLVYVFNESFVTGETGLYPRPGSVSRLLSPDALAAIYRQRRSPRGKA